MKSKEDKLLSKVIWFDNRLKFDIDFFDFLQPQRTVHEHHRYKSGLFYSKKCGRNIQYESGLELSFIQKLEEMKKVKFYFDQPIQIKYLRGRHKDRYTPDFGIYLNTGEFIIAEVKDLPGMLNHRVQLKTEALLKFCYHKGFGLLLTDGVNSVNKIKKIKCNRILEKEILSYLDEGILRKRECNEILKNCNATNNELLKIILKHNLKYKPFPFKLQYGNRSTIFHQVFFKKKRYDDIILEEYEQLAKRFGRETT